MMSDSEMEYSVDAHPPQGVAARRYLSRKLILGGVASLAFLSLLHCFIGSSLLLIVVMTTISLIGFAFLVPERLTYSNFFMFGLSMNTGYAALLIKGWLGQPLQSNLFMPTDSAVYLFLGFLSVALCAFLAKYMLGRRSAAIGRRINDARFARRAVVPLLVFGVTTKILHTIFSPDIQGDAAYASGGFGGFGTFNFVILLALSLLVMVLVVNRSWIYRVLFVAAIFIVFMLSVIHNTKKEVFDLIFLFALSIYAFNIKIKLRHAALGGLSVMVLALYVAPTIHLMRSSFGEEGITGRITMFYDVLSEHHFNPASLAVAEGDFMAGFDYSYSSAGSYVYPSNANVDRFTLVLPVDQVARGLSSFGVMGFGPFFQQMLEHVLPSILINKTSYSGVDLIGWKYGIRVAGSVARPVIGMTASSLASAGLWGVIFFPFFFMLPLFVVLDYVFGAVKGSAWGVFGVAASIFIIEREFEVMLPYLMRDMVIIVLFSLMVLFWFRPRLSANQ